VTHKSKLPKVVVELIKKLKSDTKYKIRHVVITIRFNNAGENKSLEKLCDSERLGVSL
jgi:hypothetical protein